VGDEMNDKNKKQENIEGVTENHTEVDKSKRKFSKAGMATPLIMTLTTQSALASGTNKCTISGFGSITPSGVARHEVVNCGGIVPGGEGFSPGGWSQPDVGNGNSDGNRLQWYSTGHAPNPRNGSGNLNFSPSTANPSSPGQDPVATAFNTVFTHSSRPDSFSLHDAILDTSNQLDRHAAANFLNAVLLTWGAPGHISASEIVNLHYEVLNGISPYTESEVIAFFDNLYH